MVLSFLLWYSFRLLTTVMIPLAMVLWWWFQHGKYFRSLTIGCLWARWTMANLLSKCITDFIGKVFFIGLPDFWKNHKDEDEHIYSVIGCSSWNSCGIFQLIAHSEKFFFYATFLTLTKPLTEKMHSLLDSLYYVWLSLDSGQSVLDFHHNVVLLTMTLQKSTEHGTTIRPKTETTIPRTYTLTVTRLAEQWTLSSAAPNWILCFLVFESSWFHIVWVWQHNTCVLATRIIGVRDKNPNTLHNLPLWIKTISLHLLQRHQTLAPCHSISPIYVHSTMSQSW